MTFLRDVSARFWNYVSPRKTQQRRNKEFSFKSSPLPQRNSKNRKEDANIVKEKSYAPIARNSPRVDPIARWSIEGPSTEDPIAGVELPPSPPTSLARSYSDFEGDTFAEELVDAVHPNEDDVAWDANDDTIVVDEERYVQEKAIDPEEERKRRDMQGSDLRAIGWTEDAIFLFQKLGMRGFEPLMPADWADDFPSLPYILFTSNLDKAFIKPAFEKPDSSADFHAFRALQNLLQLGSRVRDSVHQRVELRTPDKLIRRAIKKYSKWAMKDSEVDHLWDEFALFDIVNGDKYTKSSALEAKMRQRLQTRADRWRQALHMHDQTKVDRDHLPDIPTLYGVIASHTVMAFVSYDASEDRTLTLVATFDFGLEGYDVWNSLAISIFTIHCRNRLMELKESLPEPHLTSTESDPDL